MKKQSLLFELDDLKDSIEEKKKKIKWKNNIESFSKINEKSILKLKRKLKIDIHIGVAKTGTSSIQTYLATSKKELSQEGILFPKSLGSPNNVNLVIAFQQKDKVDARRKESGIIGVEKVLQYRQNLVNTFQNELDGGNYERVVISSEHLSSKLDTIGEIQTFYDFVANYTEDITLYLYLRRQDEFFVSLYSTTMKNGTGSEKFAFPDENKERFDADYKQVLQMWASVFEEKNIKIRVYEKDKLVNKDIVSDFCDFLQIPYFEKEQDQENASFDAKKLEYIRLFNADVPRYDEDKINPLRSNIVSLLGRIDRQGPSLDVDVNERKVFYERYADRNKWVSETYLKHKTLFSPPRDKDKSQGINSELSVDEAVHISAELWKLKEQEIIRLRNQLKQQQATYKQMTYQKGKKSEGHALEIYDFLRFDGEVFVNHAYTNILLRRADQSGLLYYLTKLQNNELSKLEVLGHIRYSKEGREKNVPVLGLNWRFLLIKLKKIKGIGYLLSTLAAIPILPKMLDLLILQDEKIAHLENRDV